MREWIFGVLLAAACGLVIAGVAQFSPAAGLIVAGILAAAWSWLMFGEVDG